MSRRCKTLIRAMAWAGLVSSVSALPPRLQTHARHHQHHRCLPVALRMPTRRTNLARSHNPNPVKRIRRKPKPKLAAREAGWPSSKTRVKCSTRPSFSRERPQIYQRCTRKIPNNTPPITITINTITTTVTMATTTHETPQKSEAKTMKVTLIWPKRPNTSAAIRCLRRMGLGCIKHRTLMSMILRELPQQMVKVSASSNRPPP